METKNLFDLHIDAEASGFLTETAKWGKFLSIVGFIGCGFFMLMGLMYNFLISPAQLEAMASAGYGAESVAYSRGMLSVTYFVLGVVLIFPYLYLYRFSTRIQRALQGTDQDQMNSAFANLRSAFKFTGVITIISLGFMLFGAIFAVLALSVAA